MDEDIKHNLFTNIFCQNKTVYSHHNQYQFGVNVVISCFYKKPIFHKEIILKEASLVPGPNLFSLFRKFDDSPVF